jgi:response regulator RpfG family c-di-GMP phosphodiesterase
VSRLHEGAASGKRRRLMVMDRQAGRSSLESDKARTILLLDDDSNTLLVLHAILESTKAKVIECETESCAVQHCEDLRKSIDLLVADVVLQDSNGPAVVRKVKPLQPCMRLLLYQRLQNGGITASRAAKRMDKLARLLYEV